MDKKGVLVCFLLIILASLSFVSANTVNLNLNGEEYNVSVDMFGSSNSAKFNLNNQISNYLTAQTSPYQFYPYSNAFKVGSLNIIAKDIVYQSYIGGEHRAEVILAYVLNLSEGDSPTTLNLNGEEYNVSLSYISATSVKLIVNNQITKSLTAQTSPYEFYPYSNSEKVGNLDIIVDDIIYQSYLGGEHRAEVILAYVVNLSEECTEDWACTDWSSCSTNQQTRTCTDSASCGTTENKPLETQSCSSPNPNPTPTPSCINECNITGEKSCFNQSNYEVCGNFDSDSCLEWGNITFCPMGPTGRGCYNGQCVGFPPDPNECETIGLRQNGKYCSSQYELINQKSDKVSCENSFECKSNVCLEGKCGNDSPSKLIYWIGGIILIILIIGLLIYFFGSRQ